jgi:hypothetical protein
MEAMEIMAMAFGLSDSRTLSVPGCTDTCFNDSVRSDSSFVWNSHGSIPPRDLLHDGTNTSVNL